MEILTGGTLLLILANKKKKDVVLLQAEPDHGRDLTAPVAANEAFANMNFQVINSGAQVQDTGQNFQQNNSQPVEGNFVPVIHNTSWNWNNIFNQN